MKKLLCFFLAILLLLSVVACDKKDPTGDDIGTEAPENTSEKFDDEEENEDGDAAKDKDKPASKEDDTYDGVFQTGYARVAITPNVPIGNFTSVANDIYATCLAVYDGDKTIMLVSIDMEALMEDYCDTIRESITAECGVPGDNIFVAVTHNHSAPGFNSKWSDVAIDKIAGAAKDAVDDLSDTEIFIGTGKTTGMAWVRRYVDAYGNYATVSPTKPDGASLDASTTRSVSDADDTMQLIRFVREDKKDIVATNWQAHLAHAADATPYAISSDMAYYMRRDIEEGDEDALLIYFAGASGNINLNAPNADLKEYRNYQAVARAFAKVALEVMKDENLTKIEAGKINITKKIYRASHKQDTAEEIEAARARLKAGTGDTLRQAGDRYLVARNRSTSSKLRISAISFGDLAFITAPYEMFDNNGVQIKEGSPFEMTFILTNSDGAFAYMPSYEACTEYGGYETWATYFATGVAEELVEQYLGMLNQIKENND